MAVGKIGMIIPASQKPYKQLLQDLADLNQVIGVYLEDVLAAQGGQTERASPSIESNLGAALMEVGFDLIARAVSRVDKPTPDQQP